MKTPRRIAYPPPEVTTPSWLGHCITTRRAKEQGETTIAVRLSNGRFVRRDKAALSSGCKPHPATAPAGSNRSSYGGDEIAEAFGKRVTKYGDGASV